MLKAIKKQFRVRVTSSAKREYCTEKQGGILEIAVREKAKNGKANERVRELVANFCDVPFKNVHIIKGAHASAKMILVYENNH